MTYEIVERTETKVVGLETRTNNFAPDMSEKIGGLWQKFYTPEICPNITQRANEKAVCLYTDYAEREKGDYTVVVACEVENAEKIPADCVVRSIPAGRYAKFVVRGHMIQAVQKFWQKLWEMDLPRSFVCDFEEYQNADIKQAEIHIYISLKDE